MFPTNAYAYLDPGSGSYFLQLVLGIILGGLFLLKTSWKRIINYFTIPRKIKIDILPKAVITSLTRLFKNANKKS